MLNTSRACKDCVKMQVFRWFLKLSVIRDSPVSRDSLFQILCDDDNVVVMVLGDAGCSELNGQLIERVATEFNRLQFYVSKVRGLPLVDELKPVINVFLFLSLIDLVNVCDNCMRFISGHKSTLCNMHCGLLLTLCTEI